MGKPTSTPCSHPPSARGWDGDGYPDGLRKHAGSQFDPQGTEQFVELVAAGGFEPTAVEAPCVSPGPAS